MFLTFDHNVLIDLEDSNSPAYFALRHLVSLHDIEQVTIRVPAISASERLPGKTYASDFAAFQRRVGKLSQKEFEIVKPICYLGITYLDWCVLGEEESPQGGLELKIHQVLFPGSEFTWEDFARVNNVDSNGTAEPAGPLWQKWLNRKCDVLAMWSHIFYRGDVFVTADERFHKVTKKPRLIELGAKSILRPAEAAALIAE